MSSLVYNTYKGKDGNDWAAGADSAYKVMLVTSSYTPDPDHTFPNATGLATNEVTGGSYARQNCASRTKAVNNTSDKYDHSANSVTFPALVSASPRYAIVYRVLTNDADHQLVCCVDLGPGNTATGDYTVRWNGGSAAGTLFVSA